jgi:AraC family transcriptional regulator of adaptative response / methylphosphotriester-DNA alkyltransferase methyltransferase
MENRPEQITKDYINMIDSHLEDLVRGRADEMFEIEDFAERLFIHPTHLSNTIKQTTGGSPCDIYEVKIVAVAKGLLNDPERSIKDVALTLTFDPSQFTKWFKRFAGTTPKAYRKSLNELVVSDLAEAEA